jgi:hypothetical protein
MKPIKAIQLAEDMSNWREVCNFMYPNDTYPEYMEPPEFLDVHSSCGYEGAFPTDWVIINPEGQFEVFPNDGFTKWFEEVE